jgi:hypothetical protein
MQYWGQRTSKTVCALNTWRMVALHLHSFRQQMLRIQTNSPAGFSGFTSFIQGGFECSTHMRRDGKRLDLIASTRHQEFIRQDYQLMRDYGIRTVREAIRWHLIEPSPKQYNFASATPMINAANESGMQVIWDLFHFGWPDQLDIFDPSWPPAFGDLAYEFARMWLRESGASPAFVAPVNEISFLSWAGGDSGFLNPFAQERGGELKAQLVRAALLANRALRSELPDVTIFSPEPVIHIVGDPAKPGDVSSAEAYRLSMFEAWDMLSGRLHPELGGDPAGFDVIGLNYYDRNQWWNFGTTIHVGEPEYRPFHQIIKEVFDRYQCPLFISETGTENDARAPWFAYIAGEVRTAIGLGVPVHGICLYPILNHPGWNDDRHCQNGLFDYAGEDGTRSVYQPLADEICRQEEIRRSEPEGEDS